MQERPQDLHLLAKAVLRVQEDREDRRRFHASFLRLTWVVSSTGKSSERIRLQGCSSRRGAASDNGVGARLRLAGRTRWTSARLRPRMLAVVAFPRALNVAHHGGPEPRSGLPRSTGRRRGYPATASRQPALLPLPGEAHGPRRIG